METIALLGPQSTNPQVKDTLGFLGVRGKVSVITAGWQERAGELAALRAHLGDDVVSLQLYRRAEEVFESDPDLFQALRHRQNLLHELQALYRLRLHHQIKSALELRSRSGTEELILPEREAALEAVRLLDAHHLARLQEIHRDFDTGWGRGRPKVERQRQQLGELISSSSAVLIAGGHVAVLLNRLRLFDLEPLIRTKPIVAWSAGAMILSEKIVLFHDSPPQGQGIPEVFETGLNLIPGTIPLPHANRRLRLDDPDRVALFASRFQPDLCIALDEGSVLIGSGTAWSVGRRVRQLMDTGEVRTLEWNE